MTGREVLKGIAGDEVVAALYAQGFVCVPRVPSEEMLSGAHYNALEEDAPAVWETMIGVSEGELTAEGTRK